MALKQPIMGILNNCKSMLFCRSTILIYHQQSVGYKSEPIDKTNSLNIPQKPKKPLTPFFKFVEDHRETIMKNNPNVKVSVLAKKFSEMWHEANPDLKEKYNIEYKDELVAYNMKLRHYNENLNEDQKELIKTLAKEKLAKKKKREMKKRFKETNKPKKPLTAYTLFLLDRMKVDNVPFSKLMVEGKTLWNNLSVGEKERYNNLADASKIQYESDLAKWEMNMIKLGNDDLISPHKSEKRKVQVEKEHE